MKFGVIGGGLAGTALALRLKSLEQEVVLFDLPKENTASRVAAGVLNPVVLKRMNSVWKGEYFYSKSVRFYKDQEKFLGVKFYYDLPIFRRFSSLAERNDWEGLIHSAWFGKGLQASQSKPIEGLKGEHGGGWFALSGKLDVKAYLNAVHEYFKQEGCFHEERVELDQVDGYTKVKGIDHWIFAVGNKFDQEGHPELKGLHKTKGEYLSVRSGHVWPGMVNAGHFLIPEENGGFKLGATYAWNEEDLEPNPARIQKLESFLKSELTVSSKVEGVISGFRPSTKNRRPIMGGAKNRWFLNGLGSRGVLMAPGLAENLVNHILYKDPLFPEVKMEV